jgi:hypothetical protein
MNLLKTLEKCGDLFEIFNFHESQTKAFNYKRFNSFDILIRFN